MARNVYTVEVPTDFKIKSTELETAQILAKHFKATVKVISPATGYKQKTADFIIDGISYELKTPSTSNIRSINNLIQLATKQSGNVVIDIRKSKITEKRMVQVCNERLRSLKKLKKIVLIVNKKIVLEFSK